MKKEYDFSGAVRGPVLKAPPGKTRITIRIDDDVLQWFRDQVDAAGGGNYQTLLNGALREYIDQQRPALADTLRFVLREELGRYDVTRIPDELSATRKPASPPGRPRAGPRRR
jgi:hypothetical protein